MSRCLNEGRMWIETVIFTSLPVATYRKHCVMPLSLSMPCQCSIQGIFCWISKIIFLPILPLCARPRWVMHRGEGPMIRLVDILCLAHIGYWDQHVMHDARYPRRDSGEREGNSLSLRSILCSVSVHYFVGNGFSNRFISSPNVTCLLQGGCRRFCDGSGSGQWIRGSGQWDMWSIRLRLP